MQTAWPPEAREGGRTGCLPQLVAAIQGLRFLLLCSQEGGANSATAWSWGPVWGIEGQTPSHVAVFKTGAQLTRYRPANRSVNTSTLFFPSINRIRSPVISAILREDGEYMYFPFPHLTCSLGQFLSLLPCLSIAPFFLSSCFFF